MPIAHYGVKGMRWGIRKPSEYTIWSSKPPKSSKSSGPTIADRGKEFVEALFKSSGPITLKDASLHAKMLEEKARYAELGRREQNYYDAETSEEQEVAEAWLRKVEQDELARAKTKK